MLSGLNLPYWLTLHGLVTVVAVLLYTITTHVLQQRRHPSAAIAWVLFILLVPYLALPAFLTFGSRKQARPRNRHALGAEPRDGDGHWAIKTALALGQPEPDDYTDLHVHADGPEALAALWQTIDGATRSIDLCTFIIGRDAIGHALVERLAVKARSGVTVRLMLDGLGSLMRRRPSLAPLRAAGAQVTLFVPPLHSPLKGRTNLRDHRKLLIADAGEPTRRLWCGGRNLACEYFLRHPGGEPWHDLTFDLRGEFVEQASALFAHDWAFANGRRRLARHARRRAPVEASTEAVTASESSATDAADAAAMAGTTAAAAAVAASVAATASAASAADAAGVACAADAAAAASAAAAPGAAQAPASPRWPPAEPTRAQLIASGPDQVDDTVYSLLISAAYRATRRIVLSTPYFVPDAPLLTALCLAARRGVQVDLLLPERSNHRLSDLARRRALRALSAAGGRIWATPRMQHGKLVVIDGDLALAGSANLDSRSLFLNYELMVAFHDADAVARFGRWFERERTEAHRLTLRRAGLFEDVVEGLVLWMGFQL